MVFCTGDYKESKESTQKLFHFYDTWKTFYPNFREPSNLTTLLQPLRVLKFFQVFISTRLGSESLQASIMDQFMDRDYKAKARIPKGKGSSTLIIITDLHLFPAQTSFN